MDASTWEAQKSASFFAKMSTKKLQVDAFRSFRLS